MKPKKTSMGMGMGMGMGMHMAMPADASAETYLHIAKGAVRHHDKMTAEEALNRAETRMLTRSVPQGSDLSSDSSTGVTSVQSARKAVAAGDMMAASKDIDMAMQDGGMSSDSMSSGGMSSGGMSSTSTTSSMSTGNGMAAPTNMAKSSASTGGMGSPGSTSDSGATTIGSNSAAGHAPMVPPSTP